MSINALASFPPSVGPLTIDGHSRPLSYNGVINLGAGLALYDATALAEATSIIGTLSRIEGCSVNGTLPFASLNGSVEVKGGDATEGNNGSNAVLTEGTNLTGALVKAGIDNNDSGIDAQGGNAQLILNPSRTSWNNITLDGNSEGPSGDGCGSTTVTLVSTQTSATLNISLVNGEYSLAGSFIEVSGASLTAIVLTLTSDGHDNYLSISFSGSHATDASVNNIVEACIASGVNTSDVDAFLNVGGTCATASGTTLTNIATLTALGWSVSYN